MLPEKIGVDNQHVFHQAFQEVSEWTEEEILRWLAYFEPDDYNDYCALAWDIVQIAENVIDDSNVDNFRAIGNYWADIVVVRR